MWGQRWEQKIGMVVHKDAWMSAGWLGRTIGAGVDALMIRLGMSGSGRDVREWKVKEQR
jgi:hypothetical protein